MLRKIIVGILVSGFAIGIESRAFALDPAVATYDELVTAIATHPGAPDLMKDEMIRAGGRIYAAKEEADRFVGQCERGIPKERLGRMAIDVASRLLAQGAEAADIIRREQEKMTVIVDINNNAVALEYLEAAPSELKKFRALRPGIREQFLVVVGDFRRVMEEFQRGIQTAVDRCAYVKLALPQVKSANERMVQSILMYIRLQQEDGTRFSETELWEQQ